MCQRSASLFLHMFSSKDCGGRRKTHKTLPWEPDYGAIRETWSQAAYRLSSVCTIISRWSLGGKKNHQRGPKWWEDNQKASICFPTTISSWIESYTPQIYLSEYTQAPKSFTQSPTLCITQYRVLFVIPSSIIRPHCESVDMPQPCWIQIMRFKLSNDRKWYRAKKEERSPKVETEE